MSYGKDVGWVYGRILTVNPLWFDLQLGGGHVLTFMFKGKPRANLIGYFEDCKRNNWFINIFGKKTNDAGIYTFVRSSSKFLSGNKRRCIEREIQMQQDSEKFTQALNPVRMRNKSRLGHAFRPEYVMETSRYNTTTAAVNSAITDDALLAAPKRPRKTSVADRKAKLRDKLSESAKKAWENRKTNELEMIEI